MLGILEIVANFVGAIAQSPNVPISFVMCLSVCMYVSAEHPLDRFS